MSMGRGRAVWDRLVRFTRGMRPDRNPLRRGYDRLEACLLSGAIAAAIAVAPFAVPAAASASHAAAVRVQAAELASRHQVSAVLLQRAADGGKDYPPGYQVLAQIGWRAPDGARLTGQVMVQAGAPKGSPVRVWTDSAGHLADPPLTGSQVARQAGLAGAAAGCALALLVLVECVIVRLVLDRRRMAGWDADWSVTEPTWNHQSW